MWNFVYVSLQLLYWLILIILLLTNSLTLNLNTIRYLCIKHIKKQNIWYPKKYYDQSNQFVQTLFPFTSWSLKPLTNSLHSKNIPICTLSLCSSLIDSSTPSSASEWFVLENWFCPSEKMSKSRQQFSDKFPDPLSMFSMVVRQLCGNEKFSLWSNWSSITKDSTSLGLMNTNILVVFKSLLFASKNWLDVIIDLIVLEMILCSLTYQNTKIDK